MVSLTRLHIGNRGEAKCVSEVGRAGRYGMNERNRRFSTSWTVGSGGRSEAPACRSSTRSSPTSTKPDTE